MLPIIHIGPLNLYTFGVVLALAIWLGYTTFASYYRRNGIPVPMPTAAAVVIIASLAGAKLDDAIVTRVATYHCNLVDYSFFQMLRGGYTWFGAMLSGLAAGAILIRIYRLPFLMTFDSLFCIAPAYAVGRVGCFLSGDGDYGIRSSLPWAVSFPNGLVPTTARVHPTMLYLTVWELIIFGVLWKLSSNPNVRRLYPGVLLGLYLIFTSVGRFLVEILSLNPEVAFGLKEAQIVSIGLFAVGVSIMVTVLKRSGVS